MTTKGPHLISKTNFPLLILGWWRLCTVIKMHMLVGVAMSVFIYNRAKESIKSTALAVRI